MFKNKFRLALAVSFLTTFISIKAKADDFGCEALLCFAGGKNVSECQPTIKKVLKDLAKGKPFPVCNFIDSNGESTSSNDFVNVGTYNQEWGDTKCQDGISNPFRSKKRYYCRTIEINVNPDYASDKDHQKQLYNYD